MVNEGGVGRGVLEVGRGIGAVLNVPADQFFS